MTAGFEEPGLVIVKMLWVIFMRRRDCWICEKLSSSPGFKELAEERKFTRARSIRIIYTTIATELLHLHARHPEHLP